MSVAFNLLAPNVSSIETDATGWTAGANTTRSQSSARAFSGTKSLQLTATAAGSATAFTASRVAVTPFDTVVANAYFSNLTSATGRTATVTVEWYANVTGGTAISVATSAPVTLTGTAWTTPPAILVSQVPETAHYAVVIVAVAGMTASSSALVDLVEFGPAAGITGSLMTYRDQGCEDGATGWQSLFMSTVGRTSTQSFEGWWALTQTSTATGPMRIGMVNSVPVTPGVEYFGYLWTYAPRTGATLAISLRWYDASGTQLSVSTQIWNVGTATTWLRRAVIATAPPGAVSARLVAEPTAAAIGEVWLYDQAAIMPAPALPGNLIGYSAQSFETTSTDWTATAGCTIARTTVRAWEGVASLAVTATGGDATVTLVSPFPVNPGQGYRAVPNVFTTGSTSQPIDIVYTWLNASGAVLSTSTSRWTTGTTPGWYAPIGSGVAPPGATVATVGLRFVAATAGSVFNVDNVLIAVGGLGALVDPIPNAYGASISLQGLTTGGFTTWGLWRVMPDGTTTPVRGSVSDLVATTISADVDIVEDYEAPLGVPVSYTVKVWSTPTTYLSAASSPITLPEPPETEVVIKDPTQPARWTTAVVATVPDWQRAARQGVNQVRGRARPIVISDVRSSRTGSITLVTETSEEKDQLWWVLDSGATLLIQWPSSWHERDMYVAVGDAAESHIVPIAQYADREWTAALLEVDRPYGGVVGSAARTWQDVSDENTDWDAVLAGAESWLDVLTGVRGS